MFCLDSQKDSQNRGEDGQPAVCIHNKCEVRYIIENGICQIGGSAPSVVRSRETSVDNRRDNSWLSGISEEYPWRVLANEKWPKECF